MATQFDKRMSEIFDIAEIPTINEYGEIVEYQPREFSHVELDNMLDHDLRTDYEVARNSISNLIEKGSEAVDDILSIAKSTESFKDYEVAANMIKTITEASKELLEVQKQIRDLTGKKQPTTVKNTVVFLSLIHI